MNIIQNYEYTNTSNIRQNENPFSVETTTGGKAEAAQLFKANFFHKYNAFHKRTRVLNFSLKYLLFKVNEREPSSIFIIPTILIPTTRFILFHTIDQN